MVLAGNKAKRLSSVNHITKTIHHHHHHHHPKNLIFKIKLQFVGYIYYKSDGLLHDDVRAVSSAQIAILQRTLSARKLKQKKKR